jgi:hypothetical protein
MRSFVVVGALALSASLLRAQDNPLAKPQQAPAPWKPVAGVLEFALEFGGDKIAEVLFTDGSRQSVVAGQGGTIAAGLEYRATPTSPISVRGTVGFKFLSTKADNANIGVTRIPLEVVTSYHIDKDWRVGVGVTAHTAVKFHADGLGQDISFGSAVGGTAELAWRWVGVTVTPMSYSSGNTKVNATSFGVSLLGVLRR